MNLLTLFRSYALLGFSLFFYTAIAQEYTPYQWDEKRTLTELTKEEESHGLYYIQKTEQSQFLYDPADNQLVSYITTHNIIRVNNDEALSKSNQIYIPMSNTIDLTAIKARAITKDGNVVHFDKNNIKELESEDSGYKILAIEGAEVGGEIEYFYTRKTHGSNFKTNSIQYDYPIKSYSFSLTCPENLEYAFKVYNDNGSEVLQTDTSSTINHYEFELSNIPALYEESFSAYDNSKLRMEYKLAYNSNSGKKRLFTWGDAGKRIYDLVYTLSKGEKKEFSKFIKNIDLSGDPMDAFKRTEHYIKTNYFFEEQAGEVGEQLNLIIKNKYATSRGFTKLFAAILNELNIAHEIVLVSDRNKRAFDPNFESWNYLDEYLIYINKTSQYLSPKDASFRIGTIPSKYLGSYALHVRPETIQDFIYPISNVSYIPALSYKENFDNMIIDVSFTENHDQNSINLTRSFKGYSAEYYKAALLFIEEEDKKEMLDDVIKYLAPNADIQKVEVKDANTDYNSWSKPFVVNGTFSTNSYIETAGDIILFKVGELIGPQSELYQEKERTTAIVNSYNRGYLRKINIDIPRGYTIQNIEDLIIKEQVIEDNKLIYNFVSNYSLNGQVLEIEIDEYYDELYFPIEKFEPFRKVINAAADWNKIVLVLSQ